jgi:hypothetical protein
MSKETTPEATIIKEYLSNHPTISSYKISQLIKTEVPCMYKSLDEIRNIVRYYRGACGSKNRKNMNADNYMPQIIIPESVQEQYDMYQISESEFPVIVGGDVHIPFHDQDALELFIERAIKIKAKTILLAGDWIDFYMLSKWLKDPRERDIKQELDLLKTIIDSIHNALPKSNIIYKYGNHEERFDNYIMNHAPELFKLDNMHLETKLLELMPYINIVKNKRIIRFGHLNIIHGHEYVYNITNPVNPARGLFNRAKKSSLCFHFHQTSSHTEPTISGDIITCWSGGCLCGLHPQYMPLNKWNLGFVEIVNEDGFYSVKNNRIINYKLLSD